MVVGNNVLSEENVELYDRQIRLWGGSAQKRIQNLKVLVIGASGVGIEISKNLILGGIQLLTIADDCKVTEEDIACQYTLTPSDLNSNRAEASVEMLKLLNKNVKVSCETVNIFVKPITYITQFDVVVLTVPSVQNVVFLDELCRAHGKKFFYCCVLGEFGFSVCNLTCAHILDTYKYSSQGSRDIEKMKHCCYIMFKVLHEFVKQYKRKPNDDVKDKEILTAIKQEVLTKLKLPLDSVPEEYLEICSEEFGATCTIVGGFIAQDIIQSSYEGVESGIKFFIPNGTTGLCITPDCFKL